ncbi:OLC1v1036834C1 [Oldenlandia corymbosa var. corymbosa]|uniref:OLC1v1036834C1 n=1 Tax=Oldenlandia corymbosa var. corymbosa TaxID=529605 RepID=A0AAV1CXL6_OLDCO|nr:OLC1v1036834C1 [Oldenlandia corymbosa var. corymbosa]
MDSGDEHRPSKKIKFLKKEEEHSPITKTGKIRDPTELDLKPDHKNRALWVVPDGRIFLETISPFYKEAKDFLIEVAELVCRQDSMHEYNLTPDSLYAAVSTGLDTETIISVLSKLSKTKIPKQIIDFIHESTANYGKVKLVLKKNRYFVESRFPEVLQKLLDNETIRRARISSDCKSPGEIEGSESELSAVTEEKEIQAFEIDPFGVESVKQECLPNALNYPMLEEYDFRSDSINPDLDIELKPQVQVRRYQEKCLRKMFGNNGRARSGVIVLPYGAGKSLVAVAAASRIKKSCLCLATEAASVDRWVDLIDSSRGLQFATIKSYVAHLQPKKLFQVTELL